MAAKGSTRGGEGGGPRWMTRAGGPNRLGGGAATLAVVCSAIMPEKTPRWNQTTESQGHFRSRCIQFLEFDLVCYTMIEEVPCTYSTGAPSQRRSFPWMARDPASRAAAATAAVTCGDVSCLCRLDPASSTSERLASRWTPPGVLSRKELWSAPARATRRDASRRYWHCPYRSCNGASIVCFGSHPQHTERGSPCWRLEGATVGKP